MTVDRTHYSLEVCGIDPLALTKERPISSISPAHQKAREPINFPKTDGSLLGWQSLSTASLQNIPSPKPPLMTSLKSSKGNQNNNQPS